MREKPDLWRGPARIQFGCVLMNMLGEDSLQHLHVVLAGFRSVEQSRQVAPYQQAVRTARMLLGNLQTKQTVLQAVYTFCDWALETRTRSGQTSQPVEHISFTVDPDTLRFTPCYPEMDDSVVQATAILQHGLERRISERYLADTHQDLVAILGPERSVPLRLDGMSFPVPCRHERTDRPREPIRIPVADLCSLARELDAHDQGDGPSDAAQPSASYTARMEQIRQHLQRPAGNGLRETDMLDLSGIKHLIGLPGSGKTTLIILLCVYLARQYKRVAVFFTSIEVAREYLEKLDRYRGDFGVKPAILMGRSGPTHLRHAGDVAELIAGQGNGGFGHTRPGAELFATSCPLPAFATGGWPAADDWPLGEAPCESLYPAKYGSGATKLQAKDRLICPAWMRCGRVKNQRDLVTANVWLGHVLSSDTALPAHTSLERLRFFEFIAENFDLTIFDECDATQRELDEYGNLTLQFAGDDEQSLLAELQRMTSQLTGNRTHGTEAMWLHTLRATEFERHTVRLLTEIIRLARDEDTAPLVRNYADKLLTSHFLLSEILEAAGNYQTFIARPQSLRALSDYWERAMYSAFFEREEDDDTRRWPKAAQYAAALGFRSDDGGEEADRHWQKLTRLLLRYLRLNHASRATDVTTAIAQHLLPIVCANDVEDIVPRVRLLIAVGFTVASYQALAMAARPLVQRGEIPADDHTAFFARVSEELREYVPRSLAGTFSAVRYRRSPQGRGYEVDYLVMDLAPRLLLHRLHEMGRTNVLLASATSWLEPSHQFHVDKRPDYILAPPDDELGEVRLHVLPLMHPRDGAPLYFSGAHADREENLRHMVTILAQQDAATGLSELERAVRAMTAPSGRRQRKVALVVNSYDQVRLVVDQLEQVNRSLWERTRGVLRVLPKGDARLLREHFVLKGQVEDLGNDDQVDAIVFPMAALGRGVNIVYRTSDADHGRGAVGSIYFLTRPHPAAGDLGLVTSLVAHETLAFDHRPDLRDKSLAQVRDVYDVQRAQLWKRVANLLARPMAESKLDKESRKTFAANLLVSILQTIGRGMRKGMPVSVYFVDAAWAPQSARGLAETNRSSLLMKMRDILNDCLTSGDRDLAEIYGALYGVFGDAFNDITGLIPPQDSFGEDAEDGEEQFDPSPVSFEIDLDGYDPDAVHDNGLAMDASWDDEADDDYGDDDPGEDDA